MTILSTALFGLAVVLFAFRFPRLAVALPLALHPLFLVRLSVGPLPTTALEILLVSALLGVWLRVCRAGSLAAFVRRPDVRRIIPPLAVFLAAATFSAAIAPHPLTAWGVWKAMVIEPALYAATLLFVRSRFRLEWTLLVAFLLGGFVSVGWSLASGGLSETFGRFRGVYDVPNSLALVVAPLAAFSLIASVSLTRSGARTLARVGAAVFPLALLSTQSLAALAAVVVSLAVVAVAARLRVRAVAALVGAIFLAGILWQAGSGKLAYVFHPTSSSVIARLQIWSVSLALVRDHPLVGTGLGTFEPAYQGKLRALLERPDGRKPATDSFCLLPTASCPPLEWVVRDPHTIALSFWLHTGLPGLLGMGWASAIAFRRWWLSLRRWRRGAADVPLSLAAGAAFLTLCLFGLVDVPYWKNDLALLWWALLAALAAGARPVTAEPAR